MRKQDNLMNCKYKLSFTILSYMSLKEMKASLSFQEHYMIFKLIDTLGINNEEKEKKKEIIKNVMKPIYYSENEDSFIISFGLIKSVLYLNEKIKIDIFNPLCPSNITIIIFKLESIGFVYNTTLNYLGINQFVKFIQLKISEESKFLIEQFLLFFNLLKEGVEGNPIKSSEEKFLKCFSISKKYYDKCIIDFKKHNKIKQSLTKKLQFLPHEIMAVNFDKSVNRSDNAEENEYQIQEIIPETTMIQYCAFEYISNDIKLKTFQIIEETILLFFQIASLGHKVINLKKVNKVKVSNQLKNLNEIDTSKEARTNFKRKSHPELSRESISSCNENIFNSYTCNNRSSNTMSNNHINTHYVQNNNNMRISINNNFNEVVSTKTNSINESEKVKTQSIKEELNMYIKKDCYTPDTPKFCSKYQTNNIDINEKHKQELKENYTYFEILKKIEEAKLAHGLLPTNEYINIFKNTLEITHRKFFELCFEEYFSNLFSFEKDSNNIIKLDSLYNYFIYLRGLKNLLFTEQNKIYFSNVFFYDD